MNIQKPNDFITSTPDSPFSERTAPQQNNISQGAKADFDALMDTSVQTHTNKKPDSERDSGPLAQSVKKTHQHFHETGSPAKSGNTSEADIPDNGIKNSKLNKDTSSNKRQHHHIMAASKRDARTDEPPYSVDYSTPQRLSDKADRQREAQSQNTFIATKPKTTDIITPGQETPVIPLANNGSKDSYTPAIHKHPTFIDSPKSALLQPLPDAGEQGNSRIKGEIIPDLNPEEHKRTHSLTINEEANTTKANLNRQQPEYPATEYDQLQRSSNQAGNHIAGIERDETISPGTSTITARSKHSSGPAVELSQRVSLINSNQTHAPERPVNAEAYESSQTRSTTLSGDTSSPFKQSTQAKESRYSLNKPEKVNPQPAFTHVKDNFVISGQSEYALKQNVAFPQSDKSIDRPDVVDQDTAPYTTSVQGSKSIEKTESPAATNSQYKHTSGSDVAFSKQLSIDNNQVHASEKPVSEETYKPDQARSTTLSGDKKEPLKQSALTKENRYSSDNTQKMGTKPVFASAKDSPVTSGQSDHTLTKNDAFLQSDNVIDNSDFIERKIVSNTITAPHITSIEKRELPATNDSQCQPAPGSDVEFSKQIPIRNNNQAHASEKTASEESDKPGQTRSTTLYGEKNEPFKQSELIKENRYSSDTAQIVATKPVFTHTKDDLVTSRQSEHTLTKNEAFQQSKTAIDTPDFIEHGISSNPITVHNSTSIEKSESPFPTSSQYKERISAQPEFSTHQLAEVAAEAVGTATIYQSTAPFPDRQREIPSPSPAPASASENNKTLNFDSFLLTQTKKVDGGLIPEKSEYHNLTDGQKSLSLPLASQPEQRQKTNTPLTSIGEKESLTESLIPSSFSNENKKPVASNTQRIESGIKVPRDTSSTRFNHQQPVYTRTKDTFVISEKADYTHSQNRISPQSTSAVPDSILAKAHNDNALSPIAESHAASIKTPQTTQSKYFGKAEDSDITGKIMPNDDRLPFPQTNERIARSFISDVLERHTSTGTQQSGSIKSPSLPENHSENSQYQDTPKVSAHSLSQQTIQSFEHKKPFTSDRTTNTAEQSQSFIKEGKQSIASVQQQKHSSQTIHTTSNDQQTGNALAEHKNQQTPPTSISKDAPGFQFEKSIAAESKASTTTRLSKHDGTDSLTLASEETSINSSVERQTVEKPGFPKADSSNLVSVQETQDTPFLRDEKQVVSHSELAKPPLYGDDKPRKTSKKPVVANATSTLAIPEKTDYTQAQNEVFQQPAAVVNGPDFVEPDITSASVAETSATSIKTQGPAGTQAEATTADIDADIKERGSKQPAPSKKIQDQFDHLMAGTEESMPGRDNEDIASNQSSLPEINKEFKDSRTTEATERHTLTDIQKSVPRQYSFPPEYKPENRQNIEHPHTFQNEIRSRNQDDSIPVSNSKKIAAPDLVPFSEQEQKSPPVVTRKQPVLTERTALTEEQTHSPAINEVNPVMSSEVPELHTHLTTYRTTEEKVDQQPGYTSPTYKKQSVSEVSTGSDAIPDIQARTDTDRNSVALTGQSSIHQVDLHSKKYKKPLPSSGRETIAPASLTTDAKPPVNEKPATTVPDSKNINPEISSQKEATPVENIGLANERQEKYGLYDTNQVSNKQTLAVEAIPLNASNSKNSDNRTVHIKSDYPQVNQQSENIGKRITDTVQPAPSKDNITPTGREFDHTLDKKGQNHKLDLTHKNQRVEHESQASASKTEVQDKVISGDAILQRIQTQTPSVPATTSVTTPPAERIEQINKIVESIRVSEARLADQGLVHIQMKGSGLQGTSIQLSLSGNQLHVEIMATRENIEHLAASKQKLTQQLNEACPHLRSSVAILTNQDTPSDGRSRQQYFARMDEDDME